MRILLALAFLPIVLGMRLESESNEPRHQDMIRRAEGWVERFEGRVRELEPMLHRRATYQDAMNAKLRFNEVLRDSTDEGLVFAEYEERNPGVFDSFKASRRAQDFVEYMFELDSTLYDDAPIALGNERPTACVGFLVGHRRCCNPGAGCGVCAGTWDCSANVRDCGVC